MHQEDKVSNFTHANAAVIKGMLCTSQFQAAEIAIEKSSSISNIATNAVTFQCK